MNKKPEVVRVYLPPDANTLLLTVEQCLASRDLINVIVAGKQPEPQWLSMAEARRHCDAGIGIWTWASTDDGSEPDIVMACAGDVPTMETLAAVSILRARFSDLRIRVVNVVFTAGDANRGVQTAAFNLPNDDRVIREKGSKRVMLKNVQEAKFKKVLLEIAKVALSPADQPRVSFDAFFTHILMHEMLHGLGINPADLIAGIGGGFG